MPNGHSARLMYGQASWRRVLTLIVALATIPLAACAAPPSTARPSGVGPEAAAAGPPKVLVLGLLAEPAGFNAQLVQGTGGIGGNDQVLPIAHNYLMIQNRALAYVPQLAAEEPSVDRGTWRVN